VINAVHPSKNFITSPLSHDRPEPRQPKTLHDEGWLDHPQHPRPDERSRAKPEPRRGARAGGLREVGPGDAILIPPGAWHQITAEVELVFLCCCAPPYAHEDTFFE
jgi:hypothetical protein